MIGLVLLRVAIGWHFLYQGIWKLQTPNFSAAGFLGQAKGPLAEHFYAMVPDIDGKDHLDFAAQQEGMQKYVDAFAKANSFNEKQRAAAQRVLQIREAALLDYLTDEKVEKLPSGTTVKERKLKEDFEDHLAKLEQLAERKASGARDMPFETKRIWDEQQRLRTEAAGWSKEIDKIWDSLKADLADLAVATSIRQPAAQGKSLEQIDRLVTYSNIAVGVCLIAGLFTRFSALAGALFLAQIVAAQPDWPGMYPHPHPSAGRSLIVNKEFVEMMALVALALLPTGRWAGLDFFVHNLVVRPLLGKKGAV